MSSILETLSSQLDAGTVQSISRQLNLDPATTQAAIAGALPMLVGKLAQNASQPAGAAALDRALNAHDGSIFGRVTDALGNAGLGDGILNHVFGGQRGSAEAGLGRATGLDAGSAGQILAMLAPLVLGALGKMRNQGSLGSGNLSDVLQSEHQSVEAQAPGGLGGLLGSLLDQDRDGSVMDDLAKMGGGLLGGLFKR
jgi:hypothetical protein